MKYIISKEENGKTVKDVLRYGVGLSLAFTKQLKFLDDGIMLNGERVTVRKIVKEGDILILATEDTEKTALIPTDIPISVVFEDGFIILPNKAPNMPTHPSHNHRGDTLADAIAYRYQQEDKNFIFRAISRLDRNTSGILLIAKDRISASKLSTSMKNNEIQKQYIAILEGHPTRDEGIIDTYIKREAESIIFRKVCNESEGGDRAITQYAVLAKSEKYSLVLASPKTGRTHQLRVHFAHIGAPILGDELYGKSSPLIDRHALHAYKLDFPHPKNNERVSFCAPLHNDMKDLVDKLFSGYSLDSF